VILHGISIFVASVGDIMVAKLEWSKLAQSQRQIEDVAAILRIRGDELDHGYAEKWIEELDLSKQWAEAQRVTGLKS